MPSWGFCGSPPGPLPLLRRETEAAGVGEKQGSPLTVRPVARAQRVTSGRPSGQDLAFLPGWALLNRRGPDSGGCAGRPGHRAGAGLCGDVCLRLDSPINKRFLKKLVARAPPEQNTSFHGAAVQAGKARGRLVWAQARKISGGQIPGSGQVLTVPPGSPLLLICHPFPSLCHKHGARLRLESPWI